MYISTPYSRKKNVYQLIKHGFDPNYSMSFLASEFSSAHSLEKTCTWQWVFVKPDQVFSHSQSKLWSQSAEQTSFPQVEGINVTAGFGITFPLCNEKSNVINVCHQTKSILLFDIVFCVTGIG